MKREDGDRAEGSYRRPSALPGIPCWIALALRYYSYDWPAGSGLERATELYARLEDWVRVTLIAGHRLPVFDGIDLNTEASQILATYHGNAETPISGDLYADENELESAFDERSKKA